MRLKYSHSIELSQTLIRQKTLFVQFSYCKILDLQLDCISYDLMGPAEAVIRTKNGDKLYLIIRYKRSGEFHELKVPKFFSAYFERPSLYMKHPHGKFSRTIIIDFLYTIF